MLDAGPKASSQPHYDVAVIGGGFVGSMAAIMLRKRGLSTVVLEARGEGQDQKTNVGEALTEGTSVFVRHEIGLGDWLSTANLRTTNSPSTGVTLLAAWIH